MTTGRARAITASGGAWVALTAVLNLGVHFQLWNHLLAGSVIAVVGIVLARRWEWDGVVATLLGAWMLAAGLTPGGHARFPVVWINLPAGILVAAAAITASLGVKVPWGGASPTP